MPGVVVLVLTTGCVELPLHTPVRPPAPVPQALAAQFQSRPELVELHSDVLEQHRQYVLRRVELGSTNESPALKLNLDYYQLSPSVSPVIMLLPISGGGYEAESHFARYFARRGFAVVLVRRQEINEQNPTAEAINDWLKQSIADNKRVLDWIETRPELDHARIGLFGISMGAIRGALIAPLDQRIRAAALGLAGGDLPFILSHSTEKSIVRDRNKFLREHQMSLAEFQNVLAKSITWDPSLLARYADPAQTLLLLGVFDTVVPFKKGWELRKQMGHPETVLLPTGHYSSVLCIFYVEHECLEFFRWHLRDRQFRQ